MTNQDIIQPSTQPGLVINAVGIETVTDLDESGLSNYV